MSTVVFVFGMASLPRDSESPQGQSPQGQSPQRQDLSSQHTEVFQIVLHRRPRYSKLYFTVGRGVPPDRPFPHCHQINSLFCQQNVMVCLPYNITYLLNDFYKKVIDDFVWECSAHPIKNNYGSNSC